MKNKLFNFMAKLVKKKEITEAQKNVMKYVNMLGPEVDAVELCCPYCAIHAEKLKRDKSPDAHAHKIFKTHDTIDFVEHIVNKHNRDLQTAKIVMEIIYLEAAMQGMELE